MENALTAHITNIAETYRIAGYVLLFFGVMIEGEAIMLAFSFLASQGYFDIAWVVVIAFSGVMIGDNLWYEFGLKCGKRALEKFGAFIPEKRLQHILNALEEHTFKFIFLSKFTYGLNHLVIAAAGYTKQSARKVIQTDMLSTALWLAVVSSLGYSVGYAFRSTKHYLHEIAIVAFIVLLVLIFAERIINKFLLLFSEKNRMP